MTLDTRTLVAIVKRALAAAERPPLFHETRTPARAWSRYDRILAWAGPAGRIIAWDYIKGGAMPPPGRRKWQRGGTWIA